MNDNTHPTRSWLDSRLPFLRPFCQHMTRFPMPPVNLLWTLGACLMVAFGLMVVSGLFLSLHYQPDLAQAFDSVEAMERRVPSGWLIRSIHTGGVSLLFAALYLHVGRGLWYGSYKAPRELVWLSGLFLMLLFMTTAFAGYVLPWGQMSYWGATVITHAVEAIPGIGHGLLVYLLGEDTLGGVALHRFFILHFTLGFIIAAVVGLHILCLHGTGSSNPTLDSPHPDRTTRPFAPFYVVKDCLAVCVFLALFAGLIFFLPGLLGKLDNIIPANPLKTPTDITPEWYLAPWFAMLRAVPSRLGGLIAAATSLLVLFILPWLDQSPRHNATYRPLARMGLGLFFIAFIILILAGMNRATPLWVWLSRGAMLVWFLTFLGLLPLAAYRERQASDASTQGDAP
ncbi:MULTISPECIES: cytochrome b [Acetobacteraceae]|uniref:Cytochrome b n=1 Tax=Bombella apis TaxID=1785988 RepID=A0ABR9MQG9_9PROT|nr:MULTISPECIES: cytochrome b N-terminal domain-containing protein [Acetobacteraceae]MBE1724104.1 cytochrome b N-terminal domain-containing protein [Bombella apis]MBR9730444.1 cytochrome b N-terminal domain-containing protein [Bombella apis]MCL1512740.1 cytochrome b [Parasaccharibacter sp. TMW 2.1891]MCT6813448.1 cytochrome b N-terminal domain-containing protein [Bombella apis]MPV99184.1 cytochrome b [Bombella apis]